MGRSFLICRFAGVPIRVHWSFFLLPLLFLYWPLVSVRSGPAGADRLLYSAAAMGSLVIAVLCHEMAHAFTGSGLGAQVQDIVLWPLGGFTRLAHVPAAPWPQLQLALSGPVCNLGLAAVAFGFHYLLEERAWALGVFASWNLFLGLFNLIPAYPLDGSEALRAMLRARLGAGRGDLWTARVGLTAGVAMMVCGMFLNLFFLTIVGIIAASASYRLMMESRFAGFHSPRVPKTGDFRAWRLPKSELDAETERRRKAQRTTQEMRRRVDELLRQISEKGMGSLSDADRAFLRRASEHLRSQDGS